MSGFEELASFGIKIDVNDEGYTDLLLPSGKVIRLSVSIAWEYDSGYSLFKSASVSMDEHP